MNQTEAVANTNPAIRFLTNPYRTVGMMQCDRKLDLYQYRAAEAANNQTGVLAASTNKDRQ